MLECTTRDLLTIVSATIGMSLKTGTNGMLCQSDTLKSEDNGMLGEGSGHCIVGVIRGSDRRILGRLWVSVRLQ